MIKQQFDVDGYWKVVVYYSLDYDFFDDVTFELKKIDFPKAAIEEVYDTMSSGEAKGVTCSMIPSHASVVLFNRHSSKADYINTIVHEATHVMQSMLKAYDVEDKSEAPAYTVGYLVMKMYDVFSRIIC